MGKAYNAHQLNVPHGQFSLPGSQYETEMYLVGDEAFPHQKKFNETFSTKGSRFQQKKFQFQTVSRSKIGWMRFWNSYKEVRNFTVIYKNWYQPNRSDYKVCLRVAQFHKKTTKPEGCYFGSRTVSLEWRKWPVPPTYLSEKRNKWSNYNKKPPQRLFFDAWRISTLAKLNLLTSNLRWRDKNNDFITFILCLMFIQIS